MTNFRHTLEGCQLTLACGPSYCGQWCYNQ